MLSFDRDTIGVLLAYYLGVELAFWSITVAQLTGHAERGSWRRALNPDHRDPYRDSSERPPRESLDTFFDRDDISPAGRLRAAAFWRYL
jgi:hypothetical protein